MKSISETDSIFNVEVEAPQGFVLNRITIPPTSR